MTLTFGRGGRRSGPGCYFSSRRLRCPESRFASAQLLVNLSICKRIGLAFRSPFAFAGKDLAYPGKLGRRRVDGLGCVRYLVKAVQGKEVGRDATEGEVRAEVVVVVRAPVFDEESGFRQ